MTGCRFKPHGPFHHALKSRVDEYFARTGLAPDHVPMMQVKTLIIFGWLIASYVYALLFAGAAWQVALACVSIGLAMACVGFNVQHDGGHRAYSPRAWKNAAAAGALDFIGASSYIWAYKHNVFHHSNPNKVGLDPDIDLQPLCRLAPQQTSHRWQRGQHIYIWALYSLLALKWLFDDFRDLFNGTIGGQHFPRPRGAALVQLCVGKAFFVGWSMVLPLALHPPLHVLGAWLLGSVTISLTLATVFQMAHVVEHASFISGEAPAERPWAEHQVETTADFAPHAPWVTWFVGGLNFQIEHHLFPRVCHLHLPALAKIVRATCDEFGVRYQVYPSVGAALRSHVRWLHAMGTR